MTSLPLLDGPSVPPASGGKPKQLVILIHGYGSNGDDLIGLVPHWRGLLPDAQFVSPNAPERVPGLAYGYQWWPIQTFSLQERAEGARRAGPVLDAFIDRQLELHGLSEENLALVGFSQGTMMALHAAPRRERPVAGVVAYSGMVTDEASLETDLKTRPPVLLVHGDADPVVPFAAFNHAKGVLDRLGFELDTHVSRNVGHSIDMDGLRLGGEFLKRVLG